MTNAHEDAQRDNSVPGRVTRLETRFDSLQTRVEEGFQNLTDLIKQQIVHSEKFEERVAGSRQPRYGLMLASVPVLFAVISAAWWLVITVVGQPLSEKVTTQSAELQLLKETVEQVSKISAASAIADASSAKDRENLHDVQDRVQDMLNKEITERSAEHAGYDSDKREFETQFKMASNTINMLQAENEQRYALLWEDTHPGRHYPALQPFRPQLFNPNPQSESR